MATKPLQVMDLNSLSYLYTKLDNKIVEHTESSKAEVSSALEAANTELGEAISNVNSALERVNSSLATMESDYLKKSDASSTYATKTELQNKILYGTSVPSSLAEGQLYLVYE